MEAFPFGLGKEFLAEFLKFIVGVVKKGREVIGSWLPDRLRGFFRTTYNRLSSLWQVLIVCQLERSRGWQEFERVVHLLKWWSFLGICFKICY